MRISARDAFESAPHDSAVQRLLTDDHADLDIYLVTEPADQSIAMQVGGLPPDLHLPPIDVGDVIDLQRPVGANFYRLSLLNRAYADVFFVLVDDIVDWIIRHPGKASGSRAAIDRLYRWERLLQSSSKGLSLSAQKGLFGELHVLIQLIDALGPQTALASWKGPEGGSRDFDLGGTAVEVKATSSSGLLTARISSERQLETDHLEDLFLWSVELEKNESGKRLGEMVADAGTKLSDIPGLVTDFQRKLLCVGYRDEDREGYRTRLQVRADHVYTIDSGFPRIVTSDISELVFDVAYSVDLAACEDFKRPRSAIWSSHVD